MQIGVGRCRGKPLDSDLAPGHVARSCSWLWGLWGSESFAAQAVWYLQLIGHRLRSGKLLRTRRLQRQPSQLCGVTISYRGLKLRYGKVDLSVESTQPASTSCAAHVWDALKKPVGPCAFGLLISRPGDLHNDELHNPLSVARWCRPTCA